MASASRLLAIAAGLAISAAALSGCATPTPYQPAVAEAQAPGEGYHEVRLEADRWRVVFLGNALTSRETVETYLLYRAAELTRDQGYDWFVAVARDTEAHREILARPTGGAWDPRWSPRWRIADHNGWRAWDPALDGSMQLSSVTAYEAIVEIRMGRGARPDADPAAYDARAVLESLQSRIVYPETDR